MIKQKVINFCGIKETTVRALESIDGIIRCARDGNDRKDLIGSISLYVFTH